MSEEQEFLALVAHELRNPLSNVSAAAALITQVHTRSPEDAAKLERCAHAIRQGVERMTRLIEDLLDQQELARGALRVEAARIDARALIDDCALAHAPAAAAKGLRLTADTPDEPLEVLADRVRIAQVLANLVGNAIKFTPAGGRIALAATREAAAIRISVVDTGVGIPDEDLPRIFERYWRSPTASGGLGLGLAIARALVEAHGGMIEVRSAPGIGTTVELTLPAE